MVGCSHTALRLPRLPPDDQDHQGAEGHVETMKSRGGEEGAGVKVVGETEGECEVLHHLAHQKGQAEACGDQQPASTAAVVVLSDRLAGPVEGGTAHQEQNGVEDGQGELQFIDGSIR